MTRTLYLTFLGLVLAAAAGCGEGATEVICPHVIANYTLRDVRLVQAEGLLLVTGTLKTGVCSSEDDPDERHVVLQLGVSLADFTTSADVAQGVRFEDYELPADADSVFKGELSSSWRWLLQVPIEGEPFSLEFRTGGEGGAPPMRMTLLEGDQPRLEVGFPMLEIEVL